MSIIKSPDRPSPHGPYAGAERRVRFFPDQQEGSRRKPEAFATVQNFFSQDILKIDITRYNKVSKVSQLLFVGRLAIGCLKGGGSLLGRVALVYSKEKLTSVADFLVDRLLPIAPDLSLTV